MKKTLKLGIAVLSLLGLVGCGTDNASQNAGTGVALSDIKFGLITLHDENSTYDKNFIDCAKEAVKELGMSESQLIIKSGIPETAECKEAALDMADKGCQVVFADSFGHESHMIEAAKEETGVQFCHATGTKAHTEKLSNYHNAFASIYEGRYLAGVAAGMKLNAMGNNHKIGYVGAFPYAEVISGYTSFYLGAKSVCSDATMEVKFTNSWYDTNAEKSTAEALIADGCALISQHADSMGAPSACEEKGIPDVTYNGSTETSCPNTYLISSKVNWTPYFKLIINAIKDGTTIPTDYTGTFDTDSVQNTALNTKVAADGTQAKLDSVKAELKAGTLHVFDTNNFTVNGAKVTTYQADVDDYGDYVGETEVIKDGYFHESEYRSAPYFDLKIDGITLPSEN